jgi:hypothetical protein
MTTIKLSGICERDIDLLLLEEFVASPAFLRWFLESVNIPKYDDLVSAEKSVTTSSGESDLELSVSTNVGVVKVLIEDKVDAGLQPDQPKRYTERARGYVANRQAAETRTVLVAPKAYLPDGNDAGGFDYWVSHDEILEWFEAAGGSDQRAQYKCALLARAIDRGKAGWRLVPDKAVTEFWQRYWEVARAVAPTVRMPRPSKKPASSCFVYFRPTGLHKGVSLIHKVVYGNIDLQFSGKAGDIEALERGFATPRERDMSLEAAGKSAVVRIRVAPIDMTVPFSSSEPAVQEGLRAAVRLVEWYRRRSS